MLMEQIWNIGTLPVLVERRLGEFMVLTDAVLRECKRTGYAVEYPKVRSRTVRERLGNLNLDVLHRYLVCNISLYYPLLGSWNGAKWRSNIETKLCDSI